MFPMRSILAAALLHLGLAAGALADEFPTRAVTIVVPVTPGSPTDSLARIAAERLSTHWKQVVTVLNGTGGGQNIGASRVFRSPPDGYTLLVSPPPALTVNHLLYKDITYEPSKFAPIAVLAQAPNVLIASNEFPASSLKDVIAHAKANPDAVTFGSQGLGSTAYLTMQRLAGLAGIKLRHVPYRGELPVLNDIMAGHLDIFFGTLSTAVGLYRDGKFKILAVADVRRSPALPDVPSMAELGFPDFQSTAWWALVAPPDTDQALVGKINQDVLAALAERDVAQKLEKLHLQGVDKSPSQTAAFIADETALWSGILSAEPKPE
jgi:tripartite-type tricarboxylate transporter receptor subunit TctC